MGNTFSRASEKERPLTQSFEQLRIADAPQPQNGSQGVEDKISKSNQGEESMDTQEKTKENCDDDVPSADDSLIVTCETFLGEEAALKNEEIVSKYDVKLYGYESGVKEWKEKGEGIMYITQLEQNSNKCRVIMWMQGTGRLVCNFRVFPDFKIEKYRESDKTLLWNALNFAPRPSWQTLACRFRTPEEAEMFKCTLLRYSDDEQPATK